MEESEGFSLIDVSSENDSLIAADASSSTLTHLHQSSDGTDLSNEHGEQLPQLFETAEPTLKKTGKFNLRKSLAWDTAFFESPGFLDAEDISTMIDGAERSKNHILPGIDEDISRSTESISTLVSENLALESLEAELFQDIRASIQKSSMASAKSTSNCKGTPNETDKLVKCSVKKVDVTSRNRIATNATLTRQTGGMQGSGRILKKDSSFPLVTQPGSRNGNSTSSLPHSPKVITKPETMSTITTQRASLGASRIRTETNNSKGGGKGIQCPKAAGLAGPRRSVPKPASFSKASCLASSGSVIKEVGRSSSSSYGSNSTFTDKVHKSPSTSARKKTESKPIIQSTIPNGKSKIPLRKKPSGKSGLPNSFTPSKISSSISPSSSISEWSSASSSTSTVNQRTGIATKTSCSTVNQRLSARTSIDSNSSRRSMDSDTSSVLCSDVQPNENISDGNMNQFKEFPCQDTKKTSAQSSVISQSALMKPSGLRMPSPKIGFFDGAKSVVRTPNGCRQSQIHLPTGLPKIGAIGSPVGSLKKAEGNIPPGKRATAGANTVLDTSKSASPKRSQESSMTSVKVHGATRSVLSPNISSEVRNSNKGTGKARPEMTLRSTIIGLEDQNSASPKPFQESASPGMSPGVRNEMDRSNHFKTRNVNIGKPDSAEHATANAPEAENDENLFLNI